MFFYGQAENSIPFFCHLHGIGILLVLFLGLFFCSLISKIAEFADLLSITLPSVSFHRRLLEKGQNSLNLSQGKNEVQCTLLVSIDTQSVLTKSQCVSRTQI